jgi:hypothetical protein
MSYLFNEINPFPNAAGAAAGFAGKNKAVLLTNTTGAGLTAGLMVYRVNGLTAETRVVVGANSTEIFPIRVWGVSFSSGLTGGVLA